MAAQIFGTDGIRGLVGVPPLDSESLQQLGDALALWITEKYGRNASILLAHDTRISGGLVKATLKSRLLLNPISIYDAQTLPTPAVMQIMQQDSRFHCGIIISASHNPFRDNGVKIVDAKTGKLSADDEARIMHFFGLERVPTDYSGLGCDTYWKQAKKRYVQTIIDFFPPNFLKNKKIALDCAHGAAYSVAPFIFESLGAELIVLNNQPNGININKDCGSLYPAMLQQVVVDQQADAGFAFDGDADRVVAVNRFGQLKNGDDLLALLLAYPKYAQQSKVVGTVMTNQGFEKYLERHNKELIRTPVGDKHVWAALLEHGALCGGEPAGHIILTDYLNSGDGIFTALRVLQAMDWSSNWDMHTFTKFPQVLINIAVQVKKDLTETPFAAIINDSQSKLHKGRVLVRYSGTEPLLRIMVEDDDFDHAQSIGDQLSKVLQQALA